MPGVSLALVLAYSDLPGHVGVVLFATGRSGEQLCVDVHPVVSCVCTLLCTELLPGQGCRRSLLSKVSRYVCSDCRGAGRRRSGGDGGVCYLAGCCQVSFAAADLSWRRCFHAGTRDIVAS